MGDRNPYLDASKAPEALRRTLTFITGLRASLRKRQAPAHIEMIVEIAEDALKAVVFLRLDAAALRECLRNAMECWKEADAYVESDTSSVRNPRAEAYRGPLDSPNEVNRETWKRCAAALEGMKP